MTESQLVYFSYCDLIALKIAYQNQFSQGTEFIVFVI